MYILFPVLPYVIGQNLTPKAAIHILFPVISSLGLACYPLIKFLLVAATFTTNNGVPVALQDETELGVEPPRCLFDVINHWQQTMLCVQLPALQPGTSGLPEATTALQDESHATSKMRFAVVADKNQQRLKAEDRRKQKIIKAKCPTQHDRILKLNNVTDEEDLPLIWYQMANCKKDGESVLVSMKNQVTVTANHYDKKAFRVKVHHETSFKNLEFAGDKINTNINSQLLHFTITPSGCNSRHSVAQQEEDRDNFLDYNALHSSGGENLTLAKSKTLQCSKGFIPCNWDKGEEQLWNMLYLFSALHSVKHPLAIELHKSLKLYKRNQSSFNIGISRIMECRLGIATFVYFYHSPIQKWYTNQWDPSTVGTIPPPKFCKYLNNWIQGNLLGTWLPNKDLVLAFDNIRSQPTHAYNAWVPLPNPPNPVNLPTNANTNPRSNVNNLN